MKALQSGNKKSTLGTKKGGARTNGSDFSSARGSEERHASVAATGRGGQRRLKDFDLENVSKALLCYMFAYSMVPSLG